jgi:hypothetical protein
MFPLDELEQGELIAPRDFLAVPFQDECTHGFPFPVVVPQWMAEDLWP